jgi:hypothetical protein
MLTRNHSLFIEDTLYRNNETLVLQHISFADSLLMLVPMFCLPVYLPEFCESLMASPNFQRRGLYQL